MLQRRVRQLAKHSMVRTVAIQDLARRTARCHRHVRADRGADVRSEQHDGVMTTLDVVAREVAVYGRVQGVFFRASCQEEAQRRDLAGWVSNEPDGCVRAWFEGGKEDVDTMCEWCQHGPPGALVERVAAVEREPGGLHRFVVR
jgi:acylphosphatase